MARRLSRSARIGGIVVLAIAVEAAVVHNAMGTSLSRVLPIGLRQSLNSENSSINGDMAAQFAVTGRVSEAERAEQFARRALWRNPLSAKAARNAGLAAGILGQTKLERRAFTYALMASRRDLPTLLWHLEGHVARGDIGGALHYYDVALRTSRRSQQLLMPILIGASGDPSVRTELVAYFAKHRPPWTQTFYDTALRVSDDPVALGAMTRGLLRANVPLPADAVDQAIRTVADVGDPRAAFDIYRVKTGTRAESLVRNGRFEASAGNSPFDWALTLEPGRQSALGEGTLVAEVARDTNGVIARQLLLLPAGRYRLAARFDRDSDAGGDDPYWSISCQRNGAVLGNIEPVKRSGAERGWNGQFVVPNGCDAQWLSLSVRAADDATIYTVRDVVISAAR